MAGTRAQRWSRRRSAWRARQQRPSDREADQDRAGDRRLAAAGERPGDERDGGDDAAEQGARDDLRRGPCVLWFVCVDMTLLVDGDARGESQLGEEDGRGRDHDEGREAGEPGEPGERQEGVADAVGDQAGRPGR